jgi:hypothetical protein
MSAILDTPSLSLQHDPEPGASGEGRPTLEQALEFAWRDLCTGAGAECPVCHARMGLRAAEAECRGCGSRLS